LVRTVLVVDDDDAIREAIGEVLHDEGFSIFLARDGVTALDLLNSMPPPAVIILDWFMPALDGGTLLRRLKRNPRWASTPIILISASPLDIPPDGAMHMRILPKPFDVYELTRQVRELAALRVRG
jgi:CheY-like chemotaxis protein